MGATLSTETTLAAIVLVGAAGAGYHQYQTSSTGAAGSPDTPSSVKKTKKKKKKAPEAANLQPSPLQSTSNLVETPSALPGQFDEVSPSVSSSKPRKAKKKAKRSSDPILPPPAPANPTSAEYSQLQQSTTSIDTDGSWTRVESRHKAARGDEPGALDLSTTSDAGITSSVTGSSSPIDEESTNERRTLAEKLVPRPPRTDVDDMLPEHPTLSRVMRIQPLPDEKPAPGFSWGDYEGVHAPDGEGNDADGEDDGWGVVKSKRPRVPTREIPVAEKAPEALGKKQRQNAQKREAQKAAKAAAEADRLATLAKHKRELERVRMIEQAQSNKKGKVSGGMKSVVDENGKLVWE